MSEANYFIGTCFSQLSRVSSELQFAKGLARAPPVALDRDKCVDFPHLYDVGAMQWAREF